MRATRADGEGAVEIGDFDDDRFRREVLDRLASLEAAVAGDRLRARVVDGDDDVTLLRLLGDVDLEHGDEVTVAVSVDDE